MATAAGQFITAGDDYQVDVAGFYQTIYNKAIARRVFPFKQSLKPHTRELTYYTKHDDPNFSYQMHPQLVRTVHGVSPTELATPVIASAIIYEYDELQVINDGKLPVDARMSDMAQTFITAEDRIAFTGSTLAVDGAVVTSVATVGTNSTDATTQFDVTTYADGVATFEALAAQITGAGIELVDPLALVVTPNVYTLIRGAENAYTGESLYDRLNRIMRGVNPASPGVISSKFLDATITIAAGKKTCVTASSKACLFAKNENYYFIDTSPLQVRSDGVSQLSGLTANYVERYRPVYRDKTAIIYEGAVKVT